MPSATRVSEEGIPKGFNPFGGIPKGRALGPPEARAPVRSANSTRRIRKADSNALQAQRRIFRLIPHTKRSAWGKALLFGPLFFAAIWGFEGTRIVKGLSMQPPPSAPKALPVDASAPVRSVLTTKTAEISICPGDCR